jgi:hypothetical protein
MTKELKIIYFKEVTENYDNIIKDDFAYCVYCYGLSCDLNTCKINTEHINSISYKNCLTAQCGLCSIDAMISKNYFVDKSDEVIKGELKKFYDTFFCIIPS